MSDEAAFLRNGGLFNDSFPEKKKDKEGYITLPLSLFKQVAGWGHDHRTGSPYRGDCGIYFRDTNPPCTCGLDKLRALLEAHERPL